MTESKLSKKLQAGVCILIVLTLCLCVTTFALVYSSVSVDNNLFKTGKVSIDLNGGEPIVTENEFSLQPGDTVKKDFYIQNNSTDSVYYKLFFEDVSGSLSSLIEIKILYGDKILYSGTATSLSKNTVVAADDILSIGEKRTLTAVFYLPEDTGNAMKSGLLSFVLCAEAVQSKNNPDREFD